MEMLSSGRKRNGLIFSFISIILIGYATFRYMAPSELRNKSTQRQAPEFSLRDHLGQLHTLSEFKGKVTIVHFWASWCPPCMQEIPELLAFAAQFEGRSLQVVTISLDEKWENAEKVLTSAQLPKDMLSLLDLSGKVPDTFGTFQYPETYLLDAQGHILAKWVGVQPWTSPGLQKVILQALSQGKS